MSWRNLTIRQLIESRLQTWAESNDIPVAFQKKNFTPPPLTNPDAYTHIRCFLLPASTGSNDLAGAHRVYRGVFAMNIITAKGGGAARGGTVSRMLNDLFSLNLRLSATDGFTVQIVTPVSEFQLIEGDTDDTLPTSFQYEAHEIV
jgi:hypothetical protein